MLAARARYEGVEIPVHLRYGMHQGAIYIDAGNLVLADGSAHQFTQIGLVQQMGSTEDDPNCSLKPK